MHFDVYVKDASKPRPLAYRTVMKDSRTTDYAKMWEYASDVGLATRDLWVDILQTAICDLRRWKGIQCAFTLRLGDKYHGDGVVLKPWLCDGVELLETDPSPSAICIGKSKGYRDGSGIVHYITLEVADYVKR